LLSKIVVMERLLDISALQWNVADGI